MTTLPPATPPAPIQMQPLLGRPPPEGESTAAYPTAPPAARPALQNLDILHSYETFYIDYQTLNAYALLLGGESQNVLCRIRHTQTSFAVGSNTRNWRLSDSIIKFMDSDDSGRMLFKSMRNQFVTSIESDDILLGKVHAGSPGCECDRSFTVHTSTPNYADSADMIFNLQPTGFWSGLYCFFINSCLLNEYEIRDYRRTNGRAGGGGYKVGSIKSGNKIMIKVERSISPKEKALLIAAAVSIFELYFSPSCGNVGEVGSRYMCMWTFIIITLVIVIGVIIFKSLR